MRKNNVATFKILICLWVGLIGMSCQSQKDYSISSPDKRLVIKINRPENGLFYYSFTANQTLLIENSPIGYAMESGDTLLSSSWTINKVESKSVVSEWKPVWGKREIVPDEYNELTIKFVSDKGPIKHFNLIARAYNDGIAFKYQIPDEETGSEYKVKSELTSYHFAGDYTAWYYNGEHHNLGPEKLTETDGNRHPVMTVKADEHHYMAIHEACLENGQPLIVHSEKGEKKFTVSSKPSVIFPGFSSAWRVILYGTTPGVLVDSHTIELLNPDPLPGYDFSWVKPSVAVWDWRINGAKWGDFTYSMSYPSWVRMVDFAAEEGFKYLVLDANWYGPEFEKNSDPVKGEKAKDVRRLIAYGKEKGVGIWLYLNDVGGRKYSIEETLKQYGDWGAAGVKYGFMRGSQEEKNHWTRKITELCAKNHLLVDYHDGPVHPYGQMRTWPNAVTREFCHAQLDAHRVFVPTTFVTTVFVNMVAGPLDMNNGMFDLRQGNTTRFDECQPVPSTVVSEAARTLIVFSGATILPDIPEFYKKYPDLLEFIASEKMPWKESKTLSGEIGEYIVMMRQTKDAFLIGAATNEQGRTLDIPLSFLPQGEFNAKIIEDGEDAHYLKQRETFKVSKKKVSSQDVLKVKLAPGGGCCILLKAN